MGRVTSKGISLNDYKFKSLTIKDLNLQPGNDYQLNLPENTLFIDVLLYGNGSEYSGGNIITPGAEYSYLTNTDIHNGDYNGVYVSCNYSGLVSISPYRFCGASIKGFRIWYQ